MKSLKFLITKVCVLLLFLSNTATATTTTVSSFEMLTTPDEKAFFLTAETSGTGKITVRILNQNDELVFSKKMKALNSFQQKYSLKDLEKGEYHLEIEDELKIATQPFTITATTIAVESDLKTIAYKPHFKFNHKAELLSVNWMKSDTSDCQFSIEDEAFNVLFEESVENDSIIHRSYDLSQLPKGTYYIVIKDGQHVYNKTVDVN